MDQNTKSKISRPSSTEAVTFTDGMLVTADDLQAAMHYPLSVVQVLLRSYFGCGIVCGLEVSDPNDGKPVVDKPECQPKRGHVVNIAAGVALGCDGYPIELCSTVKLDLTPDPCGCPIPIDVRETRYIAVRRVSAVEPSGRGGCGSGCGCGGGGSSQQQCTRQRDHIMIQASPKPPEGACIQPPRLQKQDGALPGDNRPSEPCECLRHCSDCDRCAEPWVIIAVLWIDRDGIVSDSINSPEAVDENGGRRHVKPIACLCKSDLGWTDRYDKMDKITRGMKDGLNDHTRRLELLEKRLADPTKTGEAEAAATAVKGEVKA